MKTENKPTYIYVVFRRNESHIIFASFNEADAIGYCDNYKPLYSYRTVCLGTWDAQNKMVRIYQGLHSLKNQPKPNALWDEFTKDDASYWEKAYVPQEYPLTRDMLGLGKTYVPEEKPLAYGFSEGLTMEEWVQENPLAKC